MPKEEILVGLDVGTTKICAVVGKVTQKEKIEVTGVGLGPCTGLKKGVVVNINQTIGSIGYAVQKAQRMSGVEIESAVVGVTGEHISSTNTKGMVAVAHPGHEITERDVERVLESATAIPLPPDRWRIHQIARNFIIDGQGGIKDPVGMAGMRLEVETHIVTGGLTFIQNLIKCIEGAGLVLMGGPEGIILESLAASEAILGEAEKEIGVALVDIGGGTTDIGTFIGGGIVHTAVLPVGGNHVTYDLAVGLRTSLEEAEKIKIEHGCALQDLIGEDELVDVHDVGSGEPRLLPRKILTEIIEPRMKEIFALIKREIGKSGYADMLAAGVVLTGGASQLLGTVELANQILDLPVRLGKPEKVAGLVDAVSNPIYSTGVGLVQYAAKYILPRKIAIKPRFLKGIANWFQRLIRRFS